MKGELITEFGPSNKQRMSCSLTLLGTYPSFRCIHSFKRGYTSLCLKTEIQFKNLNVTYLMIFCCIKQIACHHLLIMELLID